MPGVLLHLAMHKDDKLIIGLNKKAQSSNENTKLIGVNRVFQNDKVKRFKGKWVPREGVYLYIYTLKKKNLRDIQVIQMT